MTLQSGTAILDIGATQDLIGEPALRALSQVLAKAGLQCVEVPAPPGGAPAGIGGTARVTKAVLVPISPGGIPAVVNFVVIEENVPPLLSVGLLEHLGVSLDLVSNEVRFKNIGVTRHMRKESSGHRTIPLVEWNGDHFPVPKEARERFGLSEDAFMLKSQVSSAYVKQGGELPGASSFAIEIRSSPQTPQRPSAQMSSATRTCDQTVRCVTDESWSESVRQPGDRREADNSVVSPASFGPMCRSDFNSTTSCPSLALNLDHGDSEGGADGAAMASAGEQGVLHGGDHPDDVREAGDGREGTEVSKVGPPEVHRSLEPGPGEVSTCRAPHQQRKPVCELAGVQRLQCPDARINYASRGRSKAKAKPKASGAAPLTSTCPQRTQGPIFEPKPRKNMHGEVPEGTMSSSSTTSPEIATALQMMASGFQQMNNTMTELMKGQNRMIVMMANTVQEKQFGQMTFAEASEMAAQATTEHFAMHVDEEEDESWSPVVQREAKEADTANPNLLDMP